MLMNASSTKAKECTLTAAMDPTHAHTVEHYMVIQWLRSIDLVLLSFDVLFQELLHFPMNLECGIFDGVSSSTGVREV